ncbi:MAG: lytic transglycosylase domain-containing protein [Gammaproteobacteria bacterium]|nr:lytic transglycosylase domain-containing protein [Gammaproteobacteria bacterium]
MKKSIILGLVALLSLPAVASDKVTYIYRESDGSILYTNEKPNIMLGRGYVYMGSVNLPEPRVIKPKLITIARSNSQSASKPSVATFSCSANTAQQQRREADIMPVIERFARTYKVDKNLVKAVVAVESCFDPKAVSHVGAQGLMQLMPRTAQHLGVQNPFNREENIRGGVKYLRELMDRFPNNTKLALAAYNAGPTAVAKYGGIPPYRETQNYVKKVMKQYQAYSGQG